MKSRAIIVMAILSLCLAGCGGTKVLKEPEPLVVTQSLATASDQRIAATLDWVIVRDGPGTWAKNVDWDEYLIRVQNLGDDSIRVTNIIVLDSLGTQIESRENRKQLVKGTKKTKKRYKGEGLEVKAGAGAGTMMVGGVAAVAGGAGVIALAGGPIAAGGGAAVAATGLVLAAPDEKSLDIFFPLAPSPRQVELTYVDSRGDHTLIIDTHTALEGLHLAQAGE
jgi:hypothetical protein